MSSSVEEHVSLWLAYPNVVLVTGFLLVCTLTWLWLKTLRTSLDNRIPSYEFPSYTFGGIFRLIFLPWTFQKRFLDRSVYSMPALTGMSLMHRKQEIYCIWTPFTPFLVLNKAPAVEELLSSNTILEKARLYKMLHPWLGRGLLTSSGYRWRARRKLLTPSFHFDILKNFQVVFDEQAKVLVNILKTQCDKDYVDIIPSITMCSLDIICESTLGVKIGAQLNSNVEYVQCVLKATKAAMERIRTPHYWNDFIYNLLPAGRQFKRDIKVLHEFAKNVIKEKKSAMMERNGAAENMVQNVTAEKTKTSEFTFRKRKALMDLLLDVHLSNQGLTEEDIREEIDTFAFEGHDTTSAGISWALYLLGLYTDAQDKVHEELDRIFGEDTDREVTMEDLKQMNYLECVLKESQRLYPSVPMFGRQIQKDVKFCGYDVKKGTIMGVITYALHRDPDVFHDPEKFDPSRFFPENSIGRHPYSYIPFSAGPRNCIGQRFAMMEEKTVVAHVLRNFFLRSIDPRDRILPCAELVLRSLNPLKIKITKRVL